MEEFLKKMSSEVKNVSSEVVKRSKDLTYTAKQNAIIAQEEFKMKEQYKLIGELYYKIHKDDYEDPFAVAMMRLNESQQKINVAKEELKKDKIKVHKENGETFIDDVSYSEKDKIK